MKKYIVTFLNIFQERSETRAIMEINYRTVLLINVITAANFLHNQINIKDTWNICSGVPGIIYNFNNQNLVSFEDDFGYKGDLPVVVYIDFKTTAPADACFDPEQKQMFVVSYVIIFAFHPKLNIDKMTVQRSVGHSLEKLTSLDYLKNDQMAFVDIHLIKQLKDAATDVIKTNVKILWHKYFLSN